MKTFEIEVDGLDEFSDDADKVMFTFESNNFPVLDELLEILRDRKEMFPAGFKMKKLSIFRLH